MDISLEDKEELKKLLNETDKVESLVADNGKELFRKAFETGNIELYEWAKKNSSYHNTDFWDLLIVITKNQWYHVELIKSWLDDQGRWGAGHDDVKRVQIIQNLARPHQKELPFDLLLTILHDGRFCSVDAYHARDFILEFDNTRSFDDKLSLKKVDTPIGLAFCQGWKNACVNFVLALLRHEIQKLDNQIQYETWKNHQSRLHILLILKLSKIEDLHTAYTIYNRLSSLDMNKIFYEYNVYGTYKISVKMEDVFGLLIQRVYPDVIHEIKKPEIRTIQTENDNSESRLSTLSDDMIGKIIAMLIGRSQ